MEASTHPYVHTSHQQRRQDPTRTKTARRRFAQHLRARWDAIKFHIIRGIVENDAFGLQGPDIRSLEAQFTGYVDTDPSATPGVGQFDFPSSSDKAEAFEGWLNDAIDREILERYDGDQYIRTGYGRGTKHAGATLREQGIDISDEAVDSIIRAPIHEDKLELLYTRTFEELEGVTEATAQAMRRELTEGLSQGEGPRTIARNINDRVEAVGKTRSTVLARTEIIRSHAEGSLDRFESVAGDIGVTVQAEWLTADDNDVCEQCAALEGEILSIDEARGLLPLHPQCRCAFVPVVDGQQTNVAAMQFGGACEQCSTALKVPKPYCIHCEFDLAGEMPVFDLREAT